MPNQYVNKVQRNVDGVVETLIDVSRDTVTADTLLVGYTAHDATGAPIDGAYSGGDAPVPEPTPWTRPAEWPDLGGLTLSDGELYVTYDTSWHGKANGVAALYVVATGGFDWVRGHVSDGEFVPDGASTHQNTKTYLRDLLPDDPSGYVVYKLSGTITQWYFSSYLDLIGTADTNFYVQPALEVMGQLPALTTLAGGSASAMVTSFTESWEVRGAFKPVSMVSSFSHGYSLRRVAAPDIDTSALTTLASAFANCYRLETIAGIPVVPTAKCTTTASMFSNCYSLISFSSEGWNVSKVTTMASMFANCISLVSCDIGQFDAPLCTTFASMFSACRSLESIDLSGLNTSGATAMNAMFQNCTKLKEVDLSVLDTSNVTTMLSMFQNCTKLESADMHGLDVSDVTTMASLFQGCVALGSVDLSNLTIGTALTSTASMFNTCQNLREIDVSSLRTPNVTTMASMFNACSSLVRVDLTNIRATSCTNISSMFASCLMLESVDVSQLGVTSACTNTANMFSSCYSLRECPDMTAWDLSGITVMANAQTMFRYCYSLFEMTVPATLGYISNVWWQGNAVMGDAHVLSETPASIGATPFGSNTGVNVYVPASAVSAYKSAWPALAARIFAEPE